MRLRGSLRATDVAERLSSTRTALVWLVRLRWHCVGAQVLALSIARFGLEPALPWVALLGLVIGLALSNAALSVWLRSGRSVSRGSIGGVLLADTAWLTLALALVGGAENPLVVLYVVEVTLAALLLDRWWVMALVLASVVGHGALLVLPVVRLPLVLPPVATLATLAVVTAINAALAARVVTAFRERQEALLLAQREAAQAEKLASLSTLAAGAAHELATPLGTIAVAATELETLIREAPEEAASEARLIREQVARCKHILESMGSRAGSTAGELPRVLRTGELFELVRRELGPSAARLLTEGDAGFEWEAPAESLALVLANLVTNGLQASAGDAVVTLSAATTGSCVRFTVSDRGEGIAASVLPRLGEPFFTTKAPGRGLGLGLFLAFRFAKACRGQLQIESLAGAGTLVRLELPRAQGTAS